MSSNLSKSPAYRRHRDSHRGDRAYVVISGRRRYLGRYGSPDSRQRYDQLVAKPVPPAWIEATLGHLSPVVAAMVRLQLITGMRAGELVMMRGVDLDRSGPVWIYSPAKHKTKHHGYDRTIYLGGRAQAIVTPWLKHGYIFDPREAEAWIRQQRAEARETPEHYGNRPGTSQFPG